MLALLTVLVVVLISLLVTRVATVALTLTGMSRQSARFQARSALSGAGFTTSESEAVVNHPVRRRIIMVLMLVGSAGVVTAVGSLAISFSGASTGQRLGRAGVLAAGLALLFAAARSRWVDRRLSALIARRLHRHGVADVADYGTLLDLHGDFTVSELRLEAGDWVADRSLGELRLRDEGVMVLGVHRGGGGYVGVPGPETMVRPEDTLVLYARRSQLAELDERRRGRAGDAAHAAAAVAQDEGDAAAPHTGRPGG